MGLFKSKKTAKIEELSVKVSKLEYELEEALSNNKLHKDNYSKQGEDLLKLQEELKAKNNEIIKLSKTNIDLEVKLKAYATDIDNKESKLLEVEGKLKDLSSISKQLNDLKIELLEKDAKISSLESELSKAKSNSKGVKPKIVIEEDIEDVVEDDELEDDDYNVEVTVNTVENSISEVVEDSSNVEGEEDVVIPDDAIVEYVDLNSRVTGLIAREVIIGETLINVLTWKDVYKEVVEYMRKNAPCFSVIVDKRIRIGKGLRVVVSKNKDDVTVGYTSKDGKGYSVYEPLDIGGGLYLESPSLSSSDIVNRLKTLCDFVGLPQSTLKLGIVRIDN